MTEHLPECPNPLCDDECPGYEDCLHRCICYHLRTCEQRVEKAERAKWSDLAHDNWQDGWEEGIQAAREAVAALPMMKIAGNFPLYDADDALAAIDALKENP